jgi:hypothetical protein
MCASVAGRRGDRRSGVCGRGRPCWPIGQQLQRPPIPPAQPHTPGRRGVSRRAGGAEQHGGCQRAAGGPGVTLLANSSQPGEGSRRRSLPLAAPVADRTRRPNHDHRFGAHGRAPHGSRRRNTDHRRPAERGTPCHAGDPRPRGPRTSRGTTSQTGLLPRRVRGACEVTAGPARSPRKEIRKLYGRTAVLMRRSRADGRDRTARAAFSTVNWPAGSACAHTPRATPHPRSTRGFTSGRGCGAARGVPASGRGAQRHPAGQLASRVVAHHPTAEAPPGQQHLGVLRPHTVDPVLAKQVAGLRMRRVRPGRVGVVARPAHRWGECPPVNVEAERSLRLIVDADTPPSPQVHPRRRGQPRSMTGRSWRC